MRTPPDNLIAIIQIAVYHPEMPSFIEDLADGVHGQPFDLELSIIQGTMFQQYVTGEEWFQVFYWASRTWQLCSAGLIEVDGEDTVRIIPWLNPHPDDEIPIFTIELTQGLLDDKF